MAIVLGSRPLDIENGYASLSTLIAIALDDEMSLDLLRFFSRMQYREEAMRARLMVAQESRPLERLGRRSTIYSPRVRD